MSASCLGLDRARTSVPGPILKQFPPGFRFYSPIPIRLLDQTASIGKALARSWPTVFPAAPGGVGFVVAGTQPSEMQLEVV